MTFITGFIVGNLGNLAFSPFRLFEARKNKFNVFFSNNYLFLPVRKRYRLIFSSFDYFLEKYINFEWARNRGGHGKGTADATQ